ncbi:unnamed protein product [Rotaria magnacalcarata]
MTQPIHNQSTIVNPIPTQPQPTTQPRTTTQPQTTTQTQTTTQCPNLPHHTPLPPRTRNVTTTPTQNLQSPTIQNQAEDDRIKDRKFQNTT